MVENVACQFGKFYYIDGVFRALFSWASVNFGFIGLLCCLQMRTAYLTIENMCVRFFLVAEIEQTKCQQTV